ncbi:hypothetical protein [Thiobacillus sp.]|uniref:hypothetical protein n=1 Tax=Thiobacillus sp. TaxID=924 RepID=UPI00180E2FE8|nr:hypothetical protein [Thiobacillus sp.]MBC2729643.1 hypothetical protein [Thiobacillus sp.]MBC2738378.1 hypothetical protein [Thiobacillus sp.]MBC2761342.1 hypothetical protein [Thiobacillus sp.]
MPTDHCRLCGKESELQLSHVLPAFAYRWMRDSSGNGHIRASDEPNKRVQDGLKFYWLCTTCEEIFSRNETVFAGRLFHPYLKESGKVFQYSSWLIQFCISVSWRVLRFYRDEGHLKAWDPEALARVDAAESVWRDCLLGNRVHPGNYQQHLLPLDRISETTGELAPNINRYLMRAIQLDIGRGTQSIFTYAKLGRFIILGFVYEPQLNHWRGTKVHASHGYIEPRRFTVPHAFSGYLNEKARKMQSALASISDRQHDNVDKSFRANIDRYVGSDAFTAMQADVEMFGDDAFTKRGPSEL